MNIILYKIAESIYNNANDEKASVNVLHYSLSIIWNTSIVVMAALLTGWTTGKVFPTFLSIISFTALRLASGGFHFKSAWKCNLFSYLLFVSAPYLSAFLDSYIIYVQLICLLLIFRFAPNPDANAQIPPHLYKWMKWGSMAIVCLNFLFQSSVIGLVFLVQSLTIIPLKRGGT